MQDRTTEKIKNNGIKKYLLSKRFYIYFSVTFIILAASIVLTWAIINPLESISSTKYPYYLSILHPIIDKGANNSISVSLLNRSANTKNTSLIIAKPDGGLLRSQNLGNLSKKETLFFTFPTNFTENKSVSDGDYSVILAPQLSDNKTVSTLHFRITSFPAWVFSLSRWMFTSVLPLTIGLIVFAISFTLSGLYQKSSKEREETKQGDIKKREDENRILKDRSTWMIKNQKYYIYLYSGSLEVSECLRELKNNSEDPYTLSNILYSIINFLDTYTKFKEKVGVYYFGDPYAESFISAMRKKIFNLYDIIFEDHSSLKPFYGKEKKEIINEQDFLRFRDKLHWWIAKESKENENKCNCSDLYICHLLYGYALLVAVNDGVKISYSDKKPLKDLLIHEIKRKKGDVQRLRDCIFKLNLEFFGAGEHEKHYRMKFDGMDAYVATVFGKTHVKDEKGLDLYLNGFDGDCEYVNQILNSDQIQDSIIREKVQNLISKTGSKSLFDFLRKTTVVVKTRKKFGNHFYWYSHKQNPRIRTEDCIAGRDVH